MANDITLGIILKADASVLLGALAQVQSSVQKTGDALASSFEEANAALEEEIEAPEIPEIEVPEIEIDAGPIEEAAEAMAELAESVVEAEQDTKKLDDAGTEAGESVEKSFDDAGKAIEGAGKEVQKTTTELNAALSVAQDFADSTGALVDFAKEAAGAFLEFNGALAEVTTLVNSADVSNQSLSNSIMNLSLQYGAAPVDTAKALYQTLSSGASAGESANNMLAVAMQTSIGGVTDVTTAVDGLTGVINAYGMDASEANNVADTMFTTMKNGKTTIGELSANYASVVPTAVALGVSFEELNAAVVGMTLQNTGTAEAMTALNRAAISLTKPSKDLNAIFNALGYSSAEVAIKQEGLGFALNAISNAAGGSVSKIGELLGSSKAASVVFQLAGEKSHFLTDAMEKMKNKTGEAKGAFEKVMSSPEKQFEIALNKIQVATIKFGEQAIRAFLPFLEALGKIIDRVNEFANESPEAFAAITQGITLFAALAAGIGVTAVAIAGFTAFTGTIIPLFSGIGTSITTGIAILKSFQVTMATTSAATAMQAAFVGLTSIFSTFITIITASATAMKGLVLSMGPIGLVVAGVAAGFAAVSYFANQSEKDLEASHVQLKGMLETAKNFNTAIDTLKNSEVVSDEVIQQIEAVKAAVMSGRMSEADGMAIANQYLDQVKRRTEAEESMMNDLALKKGELSKLEQQQAKEVLAFRINTAIESINAEKASMNSGYDQHIEGITENLKKEVEQLKASGASTSEIAKVQAKAAQEILTVEQERAAKSVELAEKTFQKKKELLEAEGGAEVAQKVYEVEKEFAQARIDIAKKSYDEIDKRLQESVKQAEEYANKVKSLDQSIADEKLSTEDKIAQIRRRGMDEQQTQAAITQQLAQRQAQLSGAFKAGDIEGAKNYTDSLIAVSKESENTDQSLQSLNLAANEALKAGNTEEAKKLANAMSEIGGKVEDNAKAEEALQVSSNIRVAAMEKEKASAMEAQKIAEERIAKEEELKEAQRVAMEENTAALQKLTEGGESKLTISVQYDEAKAAIEELETKLTNLRDTKIGVSIEKTSQDQGQLEFLESVRQGHENNLNAIKATAEETKKLGDEAANLKLEMETNAAQTALAGIEEKINQLKNTTINVDVKTTESKAGGGVIGMAMGDVVPGVGDSDSVPAMLTPGEYVVRKARSIQFRDLLNAINYGSDDLLAKLVTLPQFNLGGFVNTPSFNLPAIRLAEGGFIPAMPQSTPQMPSESIRIDFSMGNQSGSLLASPAAEARKFAAMLREMKRGS